MHVAGNVTASTTGVNGTASDVARTDAAVERSASSMQVLSLKEGHVVLDDLLSLTAILFKLHDRSDEVDEAVHVELARHFSTATTLPSDSDNALIEKALSNVKEVAQTEEFSLFGRTFPSITVNLPIIGPTRLGPPPVATLGEAMGFTATSNNEARQREKMKAVEKAKTATKGVLNGEGATLRAKWLSKYGYPRLVGSGGIFYADQLSTDKAPMGGFNMGKSGEMFPAPQVVREGMYGGIKGWGMKAKGTAIDNLPKAKDLGAKKKK
ncbi:hypothetical protein TeGR_g13921 [Tetraparma gracilis]|uniref:Uncharacterized protein n=1 Tax=Tetraparma gracilis TaxID=2962635 RepID=A0ABQ6N799_9STRA|nr:hypothetical protein TeGR_g13921 [Tetraparma gracilis]